MIGAILFGGWCFVLGFSLGGLRCARAWKKAADKLKVRADELFEKYKGNLAAEMKEAVDEGRLAFLAGRKPKGLL